ncbi:MAG: helix-turn-helix transcriptional regulator [Gluconacetobacter diazotrophicus]|nr:helix-turn-helix transcriptional regulator [Gluconacetobacter diazotrophicus]
MRLFWRHGYEGVSIRDLCDAIGGIAPPSLYAAFGSKAALYRETLDRYRTLPGATDGLGTAGSLPDAVRDILDRAVDAVTAPDREPGCMISLGLVQGGAEHAALARDLAARRQRTRFAIARDLERWLSPPAADAMSGHLAAVMQGLAVQARDGADPDTLRRIADDVVAGIAARHPA